MEDERDTKQIGERGRGDTRTLRGSTASRALRRHLLPLRWRRDCRRLQLRVSNPSPTGKNQETLETFGSRTLG